MGVRFVDQLSADDRAALHAEGRMQAYAAGEAVFRHDDPPDRVHVLEEGRVKLVRVTANAKEVVLALRGPGDLLGELSAIDGHPRMAGAIAVEPVRTLVVPAGAFVAYLTRTPAATLAVMRMLAERLRDADARRVEYTAQDALGRVAARLVELGDAHGEPTHDGVLVQLPLSQEELAGWIGASREAVAKALGQMRALGWVSTGRRSVTLHDVEALRRRAA